jgi:hypothetical protein
MGRLTCFYCFQLYCGSMFTFIKQKIPHTFLYFFRRLGEASDVAHCSWHSVKHVLVLLHGRALLLHHPQVQTALLSHLGEPTLPGARGSRCGAQNPAPVAAFQMDLVSTLPEEEDCATSQQCRGRLVFSQFAWYLIFYGICPLNCTFSAMNLY